MVLRWAGHVPAEVQELTSGRIRDVLVRLEAVPYSTREFEAEIGHLLRQIKQRGIDWAVLAPSMDRSRIEVTVRPGVDHERVYALDHRIPLEVVTGRGAVALESVRPGTAGRAKPA
jgi:hypothetical protein